LNLIEDYKEQVRWQYYTTKQGRLRPTEQSRQIPALSAYTVAAFKKAGFYTIEQVAEKTEAELLRTRYLGRKCVKQVSAILQELELAFGVQRKGNC